MPCGCALLAYAGLTILDGSPKTMEVEVRSWENRSWGLHAIDRQRTHCKTATSSDGSRATQCNAESYKFYFLPHDEWTWASIYLRPQDVGYSLDHAERTALLMRCSCSWTAPKIAKNDPECVSALAHWTSEFSRAGQGHVAGHLTVRYQSAEGEEPRVELEFAPRLGCELMKQTNTWKGTLLIPGGQWEYVVKSYVPGEPDPRLFRVPEGYSRK